MDLLLADRWLPFELDERRRHADRARLLDTLDPPGHRFRLPLAALGRALRLAGQRLETVAAPRPIPRPIAIVVDPCGGCAD